MRYGPILTRSGLVADIFVDLMKLANYLKLEGRAGPPSICKLLRIAYIDRLLPDHLSYRV
jgi:hypothetical protein